VAEQVRAWSSAIECVLDASRTISKLRSASSSIVGHAWAALLASLCLCGCLTVRFTEGRPLAQDRIDQIRIGETTKGEILEWFGAPEGFSDSSTLESLLGAYELQPEDVFELPFADALVFRFTAGRVDARYFVVYLNAEVQLKKETLVVFFDEADRVRYFGYSGGIVPDETDDESGEG